MLSTLLHIDTKLCPVLCLPWCHPSTTTSSPPPPQYSSVPQNRHPALVECARQHLVSTFNRIMYFVCHGATLHHHFFASATALPLWISGLAPSCHPTCYAAVSIDTKPLSVVRFPRCCPSTAISSPPPGYPSVPQDRFPALVERALQFLISTLSHFLWFVCDGAAFLLPFLRLRRDTPLHLRIGSQLSSNVLYSA
jgi:hypothetical protein